MLLRVRSASTSEGSWRCSPIASSPSERNEREQKLVPLPKHEYSDRKRAMKNSVFGGSSWFIQCRQPVLSSRCYHKTPAADPQQQPSDHVSGPAATGRLLEVQHGRQSDQGGSKNIATLLQNVWRMSITGAW